MTKNTSLENRLGKLLAIPVVAAGMYGTSLAESGTAYARQVCDKSEIMEKQLETKYKEQQTGHGISNNGFLIQEYSSKEGAFTILSKSPQNESCVIATGNFWKEYPEDYKPHQMPSNPFVDRLHAQGAPCDYRSKLIEGLGKKPHNETIHRGGRLLGPAPDGRKVPVVLEILTNQETGTFSMIASYVLEPWIGGACMLRVGESWESQPLPKNVENIAYKPAKYLPPQLP